MNTYDNTPTSQALAIEARSVTQRANQANIQTLDAEAAKAATKAGPQPGFTAPMKVASETQKERPDEQPNQGKAAATPHESQAQAGRTRRPPAPGPTPTSTRTTTWSSAPPP